jgi:hypothetical protein
MAKEIDTIKELLEEAIDNGLEVEVVYSALKAMKEDNTLSPSLAIQYGYDEWIK